MIIKIKSHKRQVFEQILQYMINSKDRLFDKDQKSFCLSHNVKGNSISEWTKQYKVNEEHRQRRRKDSVMLTHEILSWHKDDTKHLTVEKMQAIAHEYISKRNPLGLYVAVPHFDKDHYHIHICASGVEYKTGKSLRLSKTNLLTLKKEIQNYQIEKFPELSKSIVEHGKKEKAVYSQKEYQMNLRTGRESQKELLSVMLKTCYKKANSIETFYDLLKDCGLKTYDRGGKTTGLLYENQKYRFNKFGYTTDRLNYLDRPKDRKNELRKVRENKSEKSKEKDVEMESVKK
jgi:hypothetical protein